MGKFVKIFLLLVGVLGLLAVAAVVIVPRVFDIEKYKPVIMERVSKMTGRQVTLEGDMHLSVFPWVGVSLTDFRLGNPEGFEEKDFIVVKSFEAHVKVMPLLSRQVQVDSFVLDRPEIYLERLKDGKANWQGLGRGPGEEPQQQERQEAAERARFAVKSVEVGTFSIRDARIRYVDRQQGVRKEVAGLTLQLTDVSLERPITLAMSAMIDGKAVAAEGTVGPLGPKPGAGKLPLALTISALEEVTARVKGQLDDPAGDLSYTLTLDVAAFSPRRVLKRLEMTLPMETGDPAALEAVSVAMNVAGTAKSAAISDGRLSLDGSNMQFKADARTFSPLNLVFEGKLDGIDLDRYLPPKGQQAPSEQSATSGGGKGGGQAKSKDYGALRKLVLDTKLNVGELKVHGGRLSNLQMHLVAKNGIFQLNPFAMELYGGNVASTAKMNVQGQTPVTSLEARTTNVQVGPALRDFAGKDILEGTLVSNVALTLQGDTPELVKKSLNGKGELLLTDGAIVGIDLAGMVRNVQASFGVVERPTEKPRTDFAELRVPFTVSNGLVNTPETAMQSPLLRVTASGDANLVNERLDMKVQPKFVATLKGQGDSAERRGLMVPVLVRGTFSSPEFSPDMTALLQGQLPDAESMKKALEGELSPEKVLPGEKGKSLEESIKNLIPGLLPK